MNEDEDQARAAYELRRSKEHDTKLSELSQGEFVEVPNITRPSLGCQCVMSHWWVAKNGVPLVYRMQWDMYIPLHHAQKEVLEPAAGEHGFEVIFLPVAFVPLSWAEADLRRGWLTITKELKAKKLVADLVEALQETVAALDSCTTQIEQMKGMFKDEDGAIAAALQDALVADQVAYVALQKVGEADV